MSETALPVDPEKSGNVWCEACQQSLPAGRAAAHLGSKKHQQSLELSSEPKVARSRAPAPRARAPADEAEPEAQAPPKAPRAKQAKQAAAPGGLIPDPSKPGNSWCGICGVSLAPNKAAGHFDTSRHSANEKKTLASAMRSPKNSGK